MRKVVGKVTGLTLCVADIPATAKFYSDVLGFRQLKPQQLAANTPTTLTTRVGTFNLRLHRSAASIDGVEDPVHPFAGVVDDNREAVLGSPLISPFPTVAVSNLKTARRLARARGGASGEPSESGIDDAGQQVLMADPEGNLAFVLHKFSRNPMLSISLSCSDVQASREFYSTCFGLGDPSYFEPLLPSLHVADGSSASVVDDGRVVRLAVDKISRCYRRVSKMLPADSITPQSENGEFWFFDLDGHIVEVVSDHAAATSEAASAP